MSSGYTSVRIQTHYDNVDEDEGMVDSSAVRISYAKDMRPMDMGILALGDPNVLLGATHLIEGKSSIAFECLGSCTEEKFEVRLCV